MNPITEYEVISAARNAALIANCSCPSRYRCTEWEKIWRDERIRRFKELKDG